MTCPYCGSEINDQAVLCVHCGKQLSPQSVQDVPKDTKTCPNCGNECHKDAVICVKCGTAFAKQEQFKKNTTPGRKEQIVFAILAAVFFAYSSFGYIAFFYNELQWLYSSETTLILSTICLVVSALLVFIGLLIFAGKKNPLPSIGLAALAALSAVRIVLSVLKNGFHVNIIGTLLMIVGMSLLAVMFLSKKQIKTWLIPAIVITAFCVYDIIAKSNEYRFNIFLFAFYFSWIIASVFMCLLVKYSKKPSITESSNSVQAV